MKRLSALLLVFCLLVPLAPARAEEVPDWARESFEALSERQVLDIFYSVSYSGSINRGDFASLLASLVRQTAPSQQLEPYAPMEEGYFSDTSSRWLLIAAGYGILEGSVDGDGLRRASPQDHLTREQAAKMVCSVLDFFSRELDLAPQATGDPATYGDGETISGWALPFTQTIASYGLMKGDDQGNFNPQARLDWPSAMVLLARTMDLLDQAALSGQGDILPLQSGQDWSAASRFGYGDYSVSQPKTGWQQNYYTISNGDGTVSGLVVGTEAITVERFDGEGALVSTRTLEPELPVFGAFFDSGDHFYLAFGENNPSKNDSQEVFRVVQYDRDWNRLGSVSVNGKDSYTDEPFRSTVARMAVSGDGETAALYAARKRYDGHQSNITILMDTDPFRIQKVLGQEFPSNHVSHSFGQFVRFDGDTMVTVDHGDAYPRSFVLQDDSRVLDLLEIYGQTGENVTNAIGSGFELSDTGCLFLGCSDSQQGREGEPWNVFLAYTGKTGEKVELRWLTESETTINCARLVKLEDDAFLALWQEGTDLHYQRLDRKGNPVGEVQVLPGTLMPPTDPVVVEGDVCWIQTSPLPQLAGRAVLYRISPP